MCPYFLVSLIAALQVGFEREECSRMSQPFSARIFFSRIKSGSVQTFSIWNGGSAKMILNLLPQFLTKRKASLLMVWSLSVKFFSPNSFTNLRQSELLSTQVMLEHPLERNSKLMFPVPQNESSTWISSKSKWLFRMLNSADLAKSVVGRTGRFRGARIFFPLCSPVMMRTGVGRLKENKNVMAGYWNHSCIQT